MNTNNIATDYCLCMEQLLNSFCIFELPYSWKLSRDPIFKDFEVFCLTLKMLSSNFFQVMHS